MSHPFIDALKNNDLDAVKALPKTDLHNHSILIQTEYTDYTNFILLYWIGTRTVLRCILR